MEKKNRRYYLRYVLIGAGAICLSIAFFFLMFRLNVIGKQIQDILTILRPILIGMMIAYLLSPLCNRLYKRLDSFTPKWAKRAVGPTSVILSLMVLVVIVMVLIRMIIPEVINSIITLQRTLPAKVDAVFAVLRDVLKGEETLLTYLDQGYAWVSENLNNWVNNILMPNLQSIVTGLSSGLISAVSIFKDVLIGLIAAIYMLAARKRLGGQTKLLIYSVLKRQYADAVMAEVKYADRMFGGFIDGKMLDSAIIGVMCYIFCLLTRMPNSLLISVVIGVTNIIPFFGPFIGAIPSILLIFIDDPIMAFWFAVFILILQQLDGNVIGPRILGGTTGLPSFWILFSILLFGGLFGILGMVLAIPAFAVFSDILKKTVSRRLRKNQCEDLLEEYRQQFPKPEAPDTPSLLKKLQSRAAKKKTK